MRGKDLQGSANSGYGDHGFRVYPLVFPCGIIGHIPRLIQWQNDLWRRACMGPACCLQALDRYGYLFHNALTLYSHILLVILNNLSNAALP